ncbi:MAG: FctA domain-containing protein, partial [Bacillota bacterium]|nr:FctA domain-containing protein [Bacillota bacterium]
NIAFDKPGKYQYKIVEKKGKLKNVIYDTTPRIVTVTVVQDEKTNELTATVEYKLDGKKVNSKIKDVTMVNRAVAEPTPGPGPDSDKDKHNKKNTKTGDEMPIYPFAGAAGISLGAIAVMLRRMLRREDD